MHVEYIPDPNWVPDPLDPDATAPLVVAPASLNQTYILEKEAQQVLLMLQPHNHDHRVEFDDRPEIGKMYNWEPVPRYNMKFAPVGQLSDCPTESREK